MSVVRKDNYCEGVTLGSIFVRTKRFKIAPPPPQETAVIVQCSAFMCHPICMCVLCVHVCVSDCVLVHMCPRISTELSPLKSVYGAEALLRTLGWQSVTLLTPGM